MADSRNSVMKDSTNRRVSNLVTNKDLMNELKKEVEVHRKLARGIAANAKISMENTEAIKRLIVSQEELASTQSEILEKINPILDKMHNIALVGRVGGWIGSGAIKLAAVLAAFAALWAAGSWLLKFFSGAPPPE